MKCIIKAWLIILPETEENIKGTILIQQSIVNDRILFSMNYQMLNLREFYFALWNSSILSLNINLNQIIFTFIHSTVNSTEK